MQLTLILLMFSELYVKYGQHKPRGDANFIGVLSLIKSCWLFENLFINLVSGFSGIITRNFASYRYNFDQEPTKLEIHRKVIIEYLSQSYVNSHFRGLKFLIERGSKQNSCPFSIRHHHHPAYHIYKRSDGISSKKIKMAELESNDGVVLYSITEEVIAIEIIGKRFRLNLNRKPNEKLERFFQRMALNIEKKKSPTDANDLNIIELKLCSEDDSEISISEELCVSLKSAKYLKVNEMKYAIHFSHEVVIDQYVFAKCPIVPRIKVGNDEFSDLLYEWRSTESPLIILSDRKIYTPKNEDVGKNLQLTVWNRADRHSESLCSNYTLNNIVEPSIIADWLHHRLQLFNKLLNTYSDNVYRIASYNLLAPINTRTRMAIEVFYPYCNRTVLSLKYRIPLFAYELLAINADIFCFQEMSGEIHDRIIQPIFDSTHSIYFAEQRDKEDGCGLLVNKEKFEVIDYQCPKFKDILLFSDSFIPLVDDIKERWPSFMDEVLPHLHTVNQIVFLKTRTIPPKYLVIGNTHLFWHPYGSHIRLLQILALANEMVSLKNKNCPSLADEVIFMIVGDLNSLPERGGIELLETGFLGKAHSDWEYGSSFNYKFTNNLESIDATNKINVGFDITMPKEIGKMIDLCKLHDEIADVKANLTFTHYVKNFKGRLDYIFSSKALIVKNCLIGVPEEIVAKHEGLPSVEYPSDHICIGVDVVI